MTLGPVFSVGVHILDILGRPVGDIPPGQGSVLLEEMELKHPTGTQQTPALLTHPFFGN